MGERQDLIRLSKSRRDQNRLEAFPTGWFVLCFSDELKQGQVLSRQFMGQDVVVYRTQSGRACVADAYCPHMGAHFGHGGSIEGEDLRCPFHGFCFDPEGACTKTGYGTKPPPTAVLRAWQTRERNGIVLVWHHEAGLAPLWEVPPLDDEGWTPLAHHSWVIRANPYDTAENAVDIGHFSVVHGYQDVEKIAELHLDGPLLKATYGMSRDGGAFGQSKRIKSNFTITKWGLGYSSVEVRVPQFGLISRHFVFGTAMNEDELDLKIAVSVKCIDKPSGINPVVALIPQKWLKLIVRNASLRAYKVDVAQDFDIWTNKTKVERPALAQGDGPIGPFRRWTEQFDPRKSLSDVAGQKTG